MIESDYLILGTGPVGVFTLKYLLERDYKVTILDNSKKINPDLKEKGLNLKDFDEKSEVYDLTNTAYINNKRIMPISSKSKGGFTKVWGGTLNSLTEQEIGLLGMSTKKYEEIYKEILSIIPNSKHIDGSKEIEKLLPSQQIEESILAMNIGDDEIWSSEELLLELLTIYSDQVLYINDADVLEVNDEDTVFKIMTTNNTIFADVSKIFICTGTFSSAQIASRMIKANYFSIGDSDLSVWPLLRIRKKVDYKKTDALSKKAYTRFIIKFIKNNSIIKFQVFEINDDVINAIEKRAPILSKIINPIILAVHKRLYLIFAYKSSKNSHRGVFQLNGNKTVKIKSIKPEKKLSVFRFFISFLKQKYLLLPFSYSYGDYGSFHTGNTTLYKNESEVVFTDLGTLKGSENIHFIDSTIMKHIPAGPFTISSIIFSRFTLEKILSEK
jgi:hypothetical protein